MLIFKQIYQEKHLSKARYKTYKPSAMNFMPSRNDVIISAFPKCGITWMESIVWSIFHQGNAFPTDKSIQDECPKLELVGKEGVDKVLQYLIFGK